MLATVYKSTKEHEKNISEKYTQPIKIMKIADKGVIAFDVMGVRKCMSKQSSLKVYITIH